MMLRLPKSDSPQETRYSMPDPDLLGNAYARVYQDIWYDNRAPSRDDIKNILMLASGYIDLTTYELGQECCVDKLRDIWRARRARLHSPPSEAKL